MNKLFTRDISVPDIKYRGLLGYREIRIFAWLCFAFSAMGIIFKLGVHLYSSWPGWAAGFEGWNTASEIIGQLPIALFLLANFSFIFSHHDNFKELLFKYLSLLILMVILMEFVFIHYFVQLLMAVTNASFYEAYHSVSTLLSIGYADKLSLNVFVDLFLFALAAFFLHHVPTSKFFAGKRIYIFRSFVFIPILYCLASMVVKMLAVQYDFTIPFYIYPLLCSKSILAFLAFLSLTSIYKMRERKFIIKLGYSREEYKTFLSTNRNKTQISLHIALTFLIFGLIDLILYLLAIVLSSSAINDGAIVNTGMYHFASALLAMGIGNTYPLIFVIPIVLLFDYQKAYKNKMIDTFVPIAGIAITVFAVFESGYLTIINSPFIEEMASIFS